MQKPKLMKEGKIIGIVVFFILPAITSTNSLGISPSHTLYVDDNNTEGPWDGTQEHPYQHIQDAVNAAKNGDAIYVYIGIYYEHVVIDKELLIQGEKKDETIINGKNANEIIFITSSNVTIKGFTITSKGNDLNNKGIRIDAYSNHHTISGNSISYCGEGIYLHQSSTNTITNNSFFHIESNAIALFHECNDNIVSGNIIGPNVGDGIMLLMSTGNTLSQNIIEHVNDEGINLHTSDNNLLLENVITSGWHTGICIKGSNNRIKGNILFSNFDFGLYLYESDSTNNLISNNRYELNNVGIFLGNNQGNTVQSNNFFHNLRNVFFINLDNTIQGNYWGRPRILPKILFGYEDLNDRDPDIVTFDWHPAWKPNEVTGEAL
jgi:parallel beta-helix repeat protein